MIYVMIHEDQTHPDFPRRRFEYDTPEGRRAQADHDLAFYPGLKIHFATLEDGVESEPVLYEGGS